MKKRDRRLKLFQDNYLDLLAQSYDIEGGANGSSYVFHNTEIGTFTFFPKSDRIQIHLDNEWLDNGMNVIITNLKLMK